MCTFPPELGGLESHVFYLCKGLVDRGHEVSVVTSRSMPHLATDEVMDGIQVHRTWMPSRTTVGWTVHALGSVPSTRKALAGADVIHAQAFSSILPCWVARGGKSVPLISTLHTSHFLRLSTRALSRKGLHSLTKLPDHNFAASKEIASVGEGLGDGVRVEALANGVDTEFFRPQAQSVPKAPGQVRLIAPRRLFEKNGVEYLIRAMPTLLSRLTVELMLVGDGPERPRLEGLANELGVSHAVNFMGRPASR